MVLCTFEASVETEKPQGRCGKGSSVIPSDCLAREGVNKKMRSKLLSGRMSQKQQRVALVLSYHSGCGHCATMQHPQKSEDVVSVSAFQTHVKVASETCHVIDITHACPKLPVLRLDLWSFFLCWSFFLMLRFSKDGARWASQGKCGILH